jgi:methyl-accepting chemotaxis protein
MHSIKAKLALGVLLVSSLFILISVGSLVVARGTASSVLELMSRAIAGTAEMSQLGFEAQKIRRFEKEYFIYLHDEPKRNAYKEQFNKGAAKISEHVQRMINNRAKLYSDQEVQLFRVWQQSADFYFQEFSAIDTAVQAGTIGGSNDANNAIKAGKDRFAVLLDGVSKEVAAHDDKLRATRALVAKESNDATYLLIGFAAILVIAICGLSLHLYNAIAAPLNRIVSGAEEIAEGRMTFAFGTEAAPEFTRLVTALENLRIRLHALGGSGFSRQKT